MDQVALDLGELRLGQRRTDHGKGFHSHVFPECPQGACGIGWKTAEDLWLGGTEANETWRDSGKSPSPAGLDAPTPHTIFPHTDPEPLNPVI